MLACRLVVDGVAFVNATAQAQAHKIAASHTSHVNSARKTASRIVRGRPNRRPRLIDPECRSIRALTKYQSMREFRTLFRRMFPAIQFGGKLPVGDQWQLPFVAHQLDVRLVIVEIYKRLDLKNIDALVLSACVQMPSLAAIQRVEDECGTPVLSASVATTHQMLVKLGLEPKVPNCGTLLAG